MTKKLKNPGGINALLTIALPLVVSQSCEILMMFTDRMFLARLGPQHMSAAMGGAFYLRYRGGHWRTLRVVDAESGRSLLGDSEEPPPLSPV